MTSKKALFKKTTKKEDFVQNACEIVAIFAYFIAFIFFIFAENVKKRKTQSYLSSISLQLIMIGSVLFLAPHLEIFLKKSLTFF